MTTHSSASMPAFREVHIQRFRRILDVRLTRLSRLNIIVGDNNSGKTSVLEAMLLLSKGLSLSSLQELHHARISAESAHEDLAEASYSLGSIDPTSQTSHVLLTSDLSTGQQQFVEFKCRRTGITGFELSAATRTEKHPVLGQITNGPFDQILPLVVPFTANGNPIPASWVGIATHRDETLQASLLGVATRSRSKRRLVSLLQEIDVEIEGLTQIQGVDGKLISMIELKHMALALPHFGDAVRRFLFLAMTITSIPNGVLLVDEAEASIHWSRFPQMAKALLELLHEFNVQAFFTTHSLELIDAFIDATPEKDDVALYRLMRAPDDGRTIVTALKEEHVRTLRHMLAHEVR